MSLPDFNPLNTYQTAMFDFGQSYSLDDLRAMTQEFVEYLLRLLSEATEEIICFVPDDPDAEQFSLPLILPTFGGRGTSPITSFTPPHPLMSMQPSRQRVTTIEQCRQRLRESLRLRLASLEMWLDTPNLKVGYTPWRELGWVNAKGIFLWGLAHDELHIKQTAKILKQAVNTVNDHTQ